MESNQVPAPKRQSLRWLWKTLGVVGGVMAGCVVLATGVFIYGVHQLDVQDTQAHAAQASAVGQAFCNDLEKQDYRAATKLFWSDPGGPDGEQTFAEYAQQDDQYQGTVQTCSMQDAEWSGFLGWGQFSDQLQVTRTSEPTFTILELSLDNRGGSTWKISDYQACVPDRLGGLMCTDNSLEYTGE